MVAPVVCFVVVSALYLVPPLAPLSRRPGGWQDLVINLAAGYSLTTLV